MNSDLLEETLALRNRYDDERPFRPRHQAGAGALRRAGAVAQVSAPGSANCRNAARCCTTWRVSNAGGPRAPQEVSRAHPQAQVAPTRAGRSRPGRGDRALSPQVAAATEAQTFPQARPLRATQGHGTRRHPAPGRRARPHAHQKVSAVDAKVSESEIVVRVNSKLPWPEERAIFEKKRDMLEKVATRPVRCESAK